MNPTLSKPTPDKPASIVVLGLAIVAGAILRFVKLDALSMSADEGASWAAASAQTVIETIRRQQALNAGKLPIHDIALHGWIALFGQSLFALRALSASAGVISIVLVYLVVWELFGETGRDGASTIGRSISDFAAAVAALLFALNPRAIDAAREVRMYSLMLTFVLAQVWVLARAIRRGSIVDYAGVAIFTAFAIAANFTASLVVMAEGIWFAFLLAARRERLRTMVGPAIAIACGLAILAPPAILASHSNAQVVAAGVLDWIAPPHFKSVTRFFRHGVGFIAFWTMIALGAWGILRAGRRAMDRIILLGLWMVVPPIALVFISWWWRPLFVPRYAVSSIVPMLILAALGAAMAGEFRARIAAVAIVVTLAAVGFNRERTREAWIDWHDAALVAAANVKPDESITVEPAYAADVVRYYLRDRGAFDVRGGELPSITKPRAGIFVVADVTSVRPEQAQVELTPLYPEIVAHLHGIAVRRYSPDAFAHAEGARNAK